jgi:ribosomal protein S4
MELNEDEAEQMRADSRRKWQTDQAARERRRYRKGLAKGRKETEAKYRPVLQEKDREIGTIKQEIEELKRKLREAVAAQSPFFGEGTGGLKLLFSK